MPYFERSSIGTFTCSKCGNVYSVEAFSLPDKDDAGVKCDCGNWIIAEHRTRLNYTFTFVRKGDPADAAKNPR